MKLLLINDALHKLEGGGFSMHPALSEFHSLLARRRRQWFRCSDSNPLGWYAALVNIPPAALLAAHCTNLPASARQCWVASPYHAQPGRNSVRVLPEMQLPWSETAASRVCAELNPLLQQEGMSLHTCGMALVLACTTPMDAVPVPFSAIAGGLLPDRHPEGADGGRMMRLLAEIQMSLHVSSQGPDRPTHPGQPMVNGLWLWGASPLPTTLPAGLPPVASLNPFLQPLHLHHGAEVAISEAEQLLHFLPVERLPDHIMLAGGGYAVLLQRTLLPTLKRAWRATSPSDEGALYRRLRELTDVA